MLNAPIESTLHRLRAGELHQVRVPAGACWTAVRGGVRVAEAPRWIGERLWQRTATLHEGDRWCSDEAGFLTLQALGDCVLVGERPASIASRLVVAWRIIRPGRAPRAVA